MLNEEAVPQRFINFAEHECKGSSMLYEFLSYEIAQDEGLLELSSHTSKGQPVPNLLFAAVHYLLLRGNDHELKQFYPSIVNDPLDYKESFRYFKDFCMINRAEIILLLQTKLVQTNEVRRCAYLYPVFSLIYEKTKKPLALIEIGTSAGLQLLWDEYAYTYGNSERLGNVASSLTLSTEIKGEITPFLSPISPPVARRTGVDLQTVDLKDEAEKLWLKALIWPEHKERLVMFEKAATYVQKNAIDLIDGDGVALIKELVADVSLDHTVCIYHTHVANQMSEETKGLLLETIETVGKERDVFHIYNNVQDLNLHLDYYVNKVESKQTIAETDGHGRWFKWLI